MPTKLTVLERKQTEIVEEYNANQRLASIITFAAIALSLGFGTFLWIAIELNLKNAGPAAGIPIGIVWIASLIFLTWSLMEGPHSALYRHSKRMREAQYAIDDLMLTGKEHDEAGTEIDTNRECYRCGHRSRY